MLQDGIQQAPEELPIEDMCSPIAAQILDFCDDVDDSAAGDLFPPSDSHQQQQHLLLHSSSDVSSTSPATTAAAGNTAAAGTDPPGTPHCCYPDDDGVSFSPFSSLDAAAISALLDAAPPLPPPDPDSDLIQAVRYACSSSAATSSSNPAPQAPAMFPIPPSFQDPFDHMALVDAITGGYAPYATTDQVVPMPMVGGASSHNQQQQQMMTAGYKEDPLYAASLVQQVSGFPGLEAAPHPAAAASYAFYDGSGCGGMGGFYHQGGGMGEAQGFYGGGMMMAGPDGGLLGAPADVGEYQRMDNLGMGLYGQDPMQRAYSPGDLQQVIGGGNQHLMTGCASSSGTMPAADAPTMDESTFKVGRLSVEERKEKIHRYMKKRNERNFSKKIKYACRKTLADSRPRVRGRFAKNDEFGETTRTTSSNHEFDDEEEAAVKEGDDILNSSDILAHISGVNSFKYNYTLESWI